jgi:hypothetical protein
MIEQPPKPDAGVPPDVVYKPGDVVNHPTPSGPPDNTSPDVHPAPPPTDPSPPVI